MPVRFLVDHPSDESLTWELDRDEVALLWKELGSCLGKDAQPQVTVQQSMPGFDAATLAVLDRFMAEQQGYEPTYPPDTSQGASVMVSPDEALAASQALQHVPQHHTDDPRQPHGSAIGVRRI